MKAGRFICTITVIATLSLITTAPAGDKQKRKPVSTAPISDFEIRNIEGWSVYINKKALTEHPEEMNRPLEHMQQQLYQIRLALPPAAVAIMQQQVPIWFEYDSDAAIAYHPSYKWLLSHGYSSPEGLQSLAGFCRARAFCNVALHQPCVVFHELTHGYDYMYLGKGRRYSNSQIKQAYTNARDSTTYDAVLCRYSSSTRHYAMNNEMEYLAENSEAYFGTNDFYPFVRAELRRHDPEMYKLLQQIWGVDVAQQNRITRSLARRLDSPRKGRTSPAKNHPASKHIDRTIEGWTVHIHPNLIENKAYGDEMIKLLGHKLHIIKRYIPARAIEKLQQIPIRLENNSSGADYIVYHPKSTANSEGFVEIIDCDSFYKYQQLQPSALLNHLARAYHDKFLSDKTAEIEKALAAAAKSGKYASVLRFDGKQVPHPALQSPQHFFAEMTESAYGVNDHYPFTTFEIRKHDPETCTLLADLWHGKPK